MAKKDKYELLDVEYLTDEQKKELQKLMEEITNQAKLVVEDYVKNPIAPDVYENFNEIYNFLLNKKYIKKTELRNIEKFILKFGNFIKKNNRVYYSSQNICDLSRQEIFLLKNIATLRKERIFRICTKE